MPSPWKRAYAKSNTPDTWPEFSRLRTSAAVLLRRSNAPSKSATPYAQRGERIDEPGGKGHVAGRLLTEPVPAAEGPGQ